MNSPKISESTVLSKHPKVIWRCVRDQNVTGVFVSRLDEVTSSGSWQSWELAGGADSVWLSIDGERTLMEIALDIEAEYGIADALKSVGEVAGILLDHGLVVVNRCGACNRGIVEET